MDTQIAEFLRERIDEGDFPSAVFLVAEADEIIAADALGSAVVDPEVVPAQVDTVYDLASLTKPLSTGLLAGKMIDQGVCSGREAVADILPELRETPIGRRNIIELATHTTGLAAWLPMYLVAKEPSKVLAKIAELPLAADRDAVYSDLNFILLGACIERVEGDEIAELFRNSVAEPLGLRRTCFRPLDNSLNPIQRRVIAASEKGNLYEFNTCVEMGLAGRNASGPGEVGLRPGLIWGEVHDGNAWFMGGSAGHAGLFSTAEEVFRLASQFLPGRSQMLSEETCRLFATNFTPGLSEHRSFAFQMATSPGSTAGAALSPNSFGHTGFAGTSVWIDPATERIFILLTNRTHARPLPFENINGVRRRFHELATRVLDGRRDRP